MSVIVKGMEIPQGNSIINVLIYADGTVYTGHVNDSQYSAVSVPTPHGVLKDTTAFDERIRDQYCKKCERRFGIKNGKRKELYEIGGVPCRACDIGDMLDWLDDEPTIIEAEGSEE